MRFFSAFGQGEMLAFFFGGQFFPLSGALWWPLEFGAVCVPELAPEKDFLSLSPVSGTQTSFFSGPIWPEKFPGGSDRL